MSSNTATYQGHAVAWEERATVRNRPRRLLEDDGLRFYPVDRQPLLLQPAIQRAGCEQQVELQSLYKYIHDIVVFETEIVNHTAREIAKGLFPFDFPAAARLDAMSVVVDEDYHAYVAMDYLDQVVCHTGVAPIEMPGRIELSSAIPDVCAGLAPAHRSGMELMAVAISENTVTADVAAFARDNAVKRSIKGLMGDHLADEGRHSGFWTRLVALYWSGIDEGSRRAIGNRLLAFLSRYLTNELQLAFDRSLVDALPLEDGDRRELLDGLVASYPISSRHPMIGNIRGFLERSGVLGHAPTRAAFEAYLGGTVQ